MEELLKKAAEWVAQTGVKILVALVVLAVAFRLITVLSRRLEKRLSRSAKLDKTLTRTLLYAGRVVLKILVAVSLVGYLGIDTSGITALITSLGVCVGLAVNGALSNLAGGILLLITRPFRVDDYIAAQGQEGTVEDIRIVSTKLRTIDNKVVYIPNGVLSSGEIVNYTEKEQRRVDLTFSVAYENDFSRAAGIIREVCAAHPKVLADPAPVARVIRHGTSSIDIVSRAWVRTGDYWDVYFDLLEQVKSAFDKAGITIPYQQLDVHVSRKDETHGTVE